MRVANLAPKRDLRAAFKGVLRDHLGAGAVALARVVFPDGAAVDGRIAG